MSENTYNTVDWTSSPVEEIVIVVDTEISASCPALNDAFHVIEHVDIGIPRQGLDNQALWIKIVQAKLPGQHAKLPTIKQSNQKLSQRVFPSPSVRV